jgi:FkbM family methyltransferase
MTRWPKLIAQCILPGPRETRTQARRRVALFLHRRFSKEMTFRRNGFQWTGTPGCLVSESIFLSDHYQDDSISALARFAKSGRPVVVNIGAHIGDVALPLSRQWQRVIAVEPNPATFATLQRNVRQNNLQAHISCHPFAISDSAGEARLVVYSEAAACELMGNEGEVGYGTREYKEQLPVQTVRLDSLLVSLGVPLNDVALVCSDTQGFESHVIQSATQLWAGGTCLWVEVWPQGLECHGGTRRFIELCKQHFRRVVRADRLDAEPEDIAALDSIVSGLKSAEGTDALLIP